MQFVANTNLSGLFNDFAQLQSIKFGDGFDTSNVTNMAGMFANSTQLQSIAFGNKFNTSAVTDMSYMFSCCTGLLKLDLTNFDTSNV